MKRTLGVFLWLLALVIGGVSYSDAKNYNLVANGYRSASVLYKNVSTSFVCLGAATWAANNGTYTENWSVQFQGGSSAWKDAPTTGAPDQLSDLATAYESRTPSSCSKLNGIVENHFALYPTGLYGGFVFLEGRPSDINSGYIYEWNHNLFERPVRSMPLGWTVTGNL